ncbi:MAG: response regulator [Deltaproteobacteria bacterium]|nr:response regulator [Deltaproteobacteria bacterium]
MLELKAYDLRMSNIEVVTAFGSDVPSTMVDGPQLQQVFLNLVNNGHQAIVASGRPGTLTIQTEADGEVIRIRIRDTGPGIAPEHLERIFDPFFTTKPAGQGTGLGLSISYGIVKGHEGQIYAESEPGQGATFVVELPILDEQTLMPVAEPKGGPQAPSLRRLLVIDDEANINSLLTDMLEAEGYQVDSALQSELALRKLSEQDYDLILCDMRMPGMDARELYHRVAGVKPHLLPRFIFTTGDLLSAETRAFLRETGGAALAKPFAREELIRVLQAAARVAA